MKFILQTSQTNLKPNCTCKTYTAVTNIRATDTGPPNLWIFPGQLNGSTVEHSTIKGPQHMQNSLTNKCNFIKLIKVHLLVSELYIFQDTRCKDKKC